MSESKENQTQIIDFLFLAVLAALLYLSIKNKDEKAKALCLDRLPLERLKLLLSELETTNQNGLNDEAIKVIRERIEQLESKQQKLLTDGK